jgi:diaminohydroxyphosphoribosylaminopyrimidine deaminase/5-amino-6-(5-phosphoribosylamino)uracil reductase
VTPAAAGADDLRWLAEAVALSRRCPPSASAFSVGAVIVCGGEVVARGYSREESPVEHAEETAIRRARAAAVDLTGATIYSSLEPCASRASGRTACCDRIAAAGLRRVVFASVEPPLFVPGRGAERLRALGIEVLQLDELAAEVRAVNAHLPWG